MSSDKVFARRIRDRLPSGKKPKTGALLQRKSTGNDAGVEIPPVVHDVVHYCVGNMPGAVPNTSTHALTNATLPFVLELAAYGLAGAVARDRALAPGVNLYRGQVVSAPVAEAHRLPHVPLATVLR